MTEDISDRLKQASNGPLQTRPDERRRYLGSLRERVFVRLSNQDFANPDLVKVFLDHFDDYQDLTILINGKITENNAVNQIEAKASKTNIPFTLVSDNSAKTGLEDTAVLVVAKEALNRNRIEIGQVYPPEFPKTELTAPKRKSFWQRLFGDKK